MCFTDKSLYGTELGIPSCVAGEEPCSAELTAHSANC